MAKTTVVPTGVVEETLTQKRFVSEAETHKSQFSGMDFWDVMESSGDAEEWQRHSYSCYVNRGVNRSGYLVKFFQWRGQDYLRDKEEIMFDGKVAQRGIGGGDFHYMLKKGSERIAEGNFNIEGPERKVGQAGSAATHPSDLVEIVRMLREENVNGQQRSGGQETAILIESMKGALAIQTQTIEMMRTQFEAALRNARGPSDTPAWLNRVGESLLPAGVALLVKMLEPKDPMAAISQVTQVMSAIKNAGVSGEPAAPDLTVELLRNGPMLLGQAGNLIEKLGQAKLIAGATTPAPRAAITAGTPSAGQPAPAASEPRRHVPISHATATAQAELRAAPTPGTPAFQDWLAGRVVAMVQNGDDGEFVLNWLHVSDPGTVKQLRELVKMNQLSAEQVGQLITSGQVHTKLVELASLPNYKQFVAEFYAALMADSANAA